MYTIKLNTIGSTFDDKSFTCTINAENESQAIKLAKDEYATELGLSTDDIEAVIIK